MALTSIGRRAKQGAMLHLRMWVLHCYIAVAQTAALVASWNPHGGMASRGAVARTSRFVRQDACSCGGIRRLHRPQRYAELDRRSDRLARLLYHRGVRVDCITAILAEHCAEYVVAYIAALKVGGAYMPLETAYPADLLTKVVENTPIVVVPTKAAFASKLPPSQAHFAWMLVLWRRAVRHG